MASLDGPTYKPIQQAMPTIATNNGSSVGLKIPADFNGSFGSYRQDLDGFSDLVQSGKLTPNDTGTGFNIADSINKGNDWDKGFFGSNMYSNLLGTGGLILGGINSINAIKNANKQIAMARDALNFQKSLANETMNANFKQYNTALADRLRARAAFETGDSTAYDDEIAANSFRRGETGNAGSGYLNYQRSANANNPYRKEE